MSAPALKPTEKPGPRKPGAIKGARQGTPKLRRGLLAGLDEGLREEISRRDPREEALFVRCSAQEKAAIEEQAARHGVTVSDLVRYALKLLRQGARA